MNGQVREIGFNGLMFMTGLIAGFGTGLLCAPRSGKETLGRIRHLANDAGVSAGRLIEDMKKTAHIVRDDTKRLVQ